MPALSVLVPVEEGVTPLPYSPCNKEILMSAPAPRLPDTAKPFHLLVDEQTEWLKVY